MPSLQPFAAIVAIAVAVGVGLGTAAHALGERPATDVVGSAPSAEAMAVAPTNTAPRNNSDEEHVEPHSGPSVPNPFDEPMPNRPVVVRPVLPLRNGMLRIPGGAFTMGSANPKAPANEHPQQLVSVSPYWIDRTEVTVAAYAACVAAGACRRPARTSSACTYDGTEPDWPVSCVHWSDAEAYCHFAKKRLPSEREWEFAARGQSQTAYPWGSSRSCAEALTLLSELSSRSCSPNVARVGTHPSAPASSGSRT